MVHYGRTPRRSEIVRQSLESLFESVKHLPCEIILVDNGSSPENTQYFIEAVTSQKITTYVRNANNLWFGKGRNQGITLAESPYVAVMDDDIELEKGWVEDCVKVLGGTQKTLVTPLAPDRAHRQAKYFVGTTEVDGEKYTLNSMSGSNCWMMKRQDFFDIGLFQDDPISGTKWNQHFLRQGYTVALTGKIKAKHLGEKIGYSKNRKHREAVQIQKTLTDGSKLTYYGTP